MTDTGIAVSGGTDRNGGDRDIFAPFAAEIREYFSETASANGPVFNTDVPYGSTWRGSMIPSSARFTRVTAAATS